MHAKNIFLLLSIGLILILVVSPGTAQVSLASPGAVWTVEETGPSGTWYGTWIVRDDGKTLDASWSGGAITDTIEIESINGDEIALYRRGNNGHYYGYIEEDGLSVYGMADWKPDDMWTVSITPEQIASTDPRVPTQDNSGDCSSGGYWELTSGDIVTVLENCDGTNYASNWCIVYDWKGGLDDNLNGNVKVTETGKSRWGPEMDYTHEYTASWDAPPGILIPNKELNIPIDIVASKTGYNNNGWGGLAWYSGFDAGSPDKPYAWGNPGSSFTFPEPTYSLGPFSGTKTFHWHGNDEIGSHSIKAAEIVSSTKGSPGDEKSIKMTFPSGPVVVYYYTWVDC